MGIQMDVLTDLIASFDPARPNFRPTELFNESWLVKLVFHQASKITDKDFPIGFLPRSSWFSESLLPTIFKARFQGDPLSESRTNADGVIGHFIIGSKGKADLDLHTNAEQFTVVEAKIGAPLSSGTSNAKYFDQAARNIACMAEVLRRARVHPSSLSRLDFVVLAPFHSIEKGTFSKEMNLTSIRSKVARRISEYEGALDNWISDFFEPLMDHLSLHSLSWEEAIDWIGKYENDASQKLEEFYRFCLQFN
jgi:hypothetical protein